MPAPKSKTFIARVTVKTTEPQYKKDIREMIQAALDSFDWDAWALNVKSAKASSIDEQ